MAIHQQSSEKTVSFQQIPILDAQTNGRLSTPTRMHNGDSESIHDNNHISLQQTITISPLKSQHMRQASNTDNAQSMNNEGVSRPTLVSPMVNTNQQRYNDTYPYHHQDDKVSHRTVSGSSLSRNSLEPFPPPPQNLDAFDSVSNDMAKQRSTSVMSNRSSVHDAPNEQIMMTQVS